MLSKQIFDFVFSHSTEKHYKKFFDKTMCKALNHNSNLE